MAHSYKALTYAGRSFDICGTPGDAYFDGIEHHIVNNEFLVALLAHHVSAGSVVIDVGANVGVCTVLAHKLVPDCRTISVEPSNVYADLVATIKRNGISSNTTMECCVGSTDAETSFVDASGDSSASHIIASGSGPKKRLVTVDTLVRELGLQRVDFVKIDVEGFEANVLDGMRTTNRMHQPLILMEFNSFTLTTYGDTSPRRLLDRIVDEFGYFLSNQGGVLKTVRSPDEVVAFLHTNMLHNGCVDDIAFTASARRKHAFSL